MHHLAQSCLTTTVTNYMTGHCCCHILPPDVYSVFPGHTAPCVDNVSLSVFSSLLSECALHVSPGFPGGAFAPDLVNQSQHLFASHQGDSLRELASVAVDHPMTSEGLVDASAGDTGRPHQCHGL